MTVLGHLFPEVPPEVMTPRARAYLGATAAYCIGIGAGCLLVPERFTSLSFGVIQRIMPFGFHGWGVLHLVLAAFAVVAAWLGKERPATYTLIGGAALVGTWAYGFWHAYITLANPGAPTALCAYTFITVVHLIMARQPLRSPFEPLLRGIQRED